MVDLKKVCKLNIRGQSSCNIGIYDVEDIQGIDIINMTCIAIFKCVILYVFLNEILLKMLNHKPHMNMVSPLYVISCVVSNYNSVQMLTHIPHMNKGFHQCVISYVFPNLNSIESLNHTTYMDIAF